MTAAQQYQQIIQASRRAQLAQDAQAVQSLERMLAKAAADISREIRAVPRGLLGERYRRQLLGGLTQVLDAFRDDYKALLDAGILESARIADARERDILQAAYSDRYQFRPDQALQLSAAQGEAAVSFGHVPGLVLERLYARSYPDGLRLSQRLRNLDLAARRAVLDEVGTALATGASARKLAAAIAPHLTAAGVDNVRYKAMRIARTEINTAYREGHIASVTDEDGKLKPYVEAIGWRLSPAHPRIDICDAWAGDDTENLGAGNYSPDNVPPGHPHCLCFTVSILAALPDQQFTSKAARPQDVPASQRRYYGDTNYGDSNYGDSIDD